MNRPKLLLPLLLTASPAHAENDAQFWLTLYGEAKLDDNDSLTANIILRSRPDELETGQRLLRAGLSHKLNGGVSLSLAYAHVRSFNEGAPDTIQHRLSQGISFPISKAVEMRIQAEEIFARGGDDIGLRGRGRVRWTQALNQIGDIELQLSDELIWSLNSTDWGQRAGWTANRAGAAVRFRLDNHFAIAPGYTWQLANRRGTANRNDHIFGLTVESRF